MEDISTALAAHKAAHKELVDDLLQRERNAKTELEAVHNALVELGERRRTRGKAKTKEPVAEPQAKSSKSKAKK